MQARQKAQANHLTNIDFIEKNVEDLVPMESQVDCILCSSGLAYFEDVQRVLALCHAWLKPGGSLLFNTPKVNLPCTAFLQGERTRFAGPAGCSGSLKY